MSCQVFTTASGRNFQVIHPPANAEGTQVQTAGTDPNVESSWALTARRTVAAHPEVCGHNLSWRHPSQRAED